MVLNCPNCGALLKRCRFVTVCEYCGVVMEDGKPAIAPTTSTKNEAKEHLAYLRANIEYVKGSPFLGEIINVSGGYRITSPSFYACDPYDRKIDNPTYIFRYENDGSIESVAIGIIGDKLAKKMVMKLDEEIVVLASIDKTENTTWYRLSIDQLLQICTARDIDIDTGLETTELALYHELATFASRFYNLVFNRLKFHYSINVGLVTDL